MKKEISKKRARKGAAQLQQLAARGKFAEAIEIATAIYNSDKKNMEAITTLATLLAQTGGFDESIFYFQLAADIQPKNPVALYNLAHAHQINCNYRAAIEFYKKALCYNVNFTEAKCNLAYCLHLIGASAEADQILNDFPTNGIKSLEIILTHAAIKLDLLKPEEAIDLAKQALRINSNLEKAHIIIGAAKFSQNNADEAFTSFTSALLTNPNNAEAHFGLARIHSERKRPIEAVHHLKEAVKNKPDFLDALIMLGHHLKEIGRPDEGIDCFNHALLIAPKNTLAMLGLAFTHEYNGQWNDAESIYREILETEIDNLEATGGLAFILEKSGRIQEAKRLLTALGDKINRNSHCLTVMAKVLREEGLHEAAIALLEKHSDSRFFNDAQLASINFVLGQIYDKNEQYAHAFDKFFKANSLSSLKSNLTYDPKHHEAYVDWCNDIFSDNGSLQSLYVENRSEKPIFVIGMPRSGTSLVEQILASHPDVCGAGELPDVYEFANTGKINLGHYRRKPLAASLNTIPKEHFSDFSAKYLQKLDTLAPNVKRVVDKFPGNFLNLGLIQICFPNAKIIHCSRSPVDTCLSIYFNEFSISQTYATSLDSLGHFYNQYDRLMKIWKQALEIPIFEIQYESLVAEPQPTIERLIEFVGLEWNESCLSFHKTKRVVNTPSYHQVRKPIYQKSVSRWKNYEDKISLLLDSLEPSLRKS